jgi:hypothetical protein
MSDKIPKGAVEAATEISLRIHNIWDLHLSDEEVEFFAAIIAEAVRPMVESATLVDNDFRANNPILRESLEMLRTALNAWKGEG